MGRLADPQLFKTAYNLGRQIIVTTMFFIKFTPSQFRFGIKNCLKIENWTILGRLADPQYWAQNTQVGIFSINMTPFNLEFVQEFVKNFQIAPFLADWQTPQIAPFLINWQTPPPFLKKLRGDKSSKM